MSIVYPETFGEAFWEPQVRATKQYADDEEKALEAYVHALVGLVPHVEGLSLDFLAPLQDFGTTGHFANAELGKQVLGSHVSSGIMSAFEPWLRGIGYAANKDRPNKLIDVDQIMTLGHRRKIIPDVFADRVGWNGFTADEAKMAYDASSPYPDTLSLLQWARYTTDDNATFTKFQSKMDISDEEFQIWDFMGRLRLNENHMHELVTRGYMTREQAVDELIRDGYQRVDAEAVIDLGYAIPSPALLLQTALLKGSSYTESAQQVFERAQAGLKLTDPQARQEYFDSFVGGVILGGTLAPAGRFVERGGEKSKAEAFLLKTDLEKSKAEYEAEQAARKQAAAEKAALEKPQGDLVTAMGDEIGEKGYSLLPQFQLQKNAFALATKADIPAESLQGMDPTEILAATKQKLTQDIEEQNRVLPLLTAQRDAAGFC